MDQLIKLLQEKTGLSDEMAQKVASFIQENIHQIPQLLSGDLGDQLEKKGLGGVVDAAKGMFGNKE